MPTAKILAQPDEQPGLKETGNIKRLLDNLLSCGMPGDSQSPFMRRIRFTNIFVIITVAALLVFSVVNLMSEQYLGFVFELFSGLLGIFTIIQMRISGNIERAQTLILLNLLLVMTYLFVSGGIAGTGIFWWFTYPVAAFFIKGRRRGWLWVVIIIVEALVMMLLGKFFNVNVPYSFVELRQFLAAFLVVSIILRHYEVLRDDYEKTIESNMHILEEANANIKTLRGLVPICASCKKIRNDKGYWQLVEVYVAEHSEAHFSHGLCEECSRKLYPEYSQNNDVQNS